MRLEVRLETDREALVVGHLLSVERRIFFQYAPTFRASRLELSPFKLPLEVDAAVEEPTRTYGGLHGLFNDSLPDGWGLILMERALRARGVHADRLTPLDRLAYIGTRGMGALTYHPSSESPSDDSLELDISAVAEQAERLLDGSPEELLPTLALAGGSPMGARPKVVVGVRADFSRLVTGTSLLPAGYRHWLIKFAAKGDPDDVGPIESAYADMARAAGIRLPPTSLFRTRDGRHYFGVERFDRDPEHPARRFHVHTFAGLVHHDHRIPGQDYLDLLAVTRALTQHHHEVLEAFRRMVFNVLAHNRDDHTKNFAFRMQPNGEWRLAPAYDVTFSSGPAGEHTMMIAGAGAVPTRAHVDAVADASSIDDRDVRETIDIVRATVANWPIFAARHGVSSGSVRRIAQRLDEVRHAFDSTPPTAPRSRRRRRG